MRFIKFFSGRMEARPFCCFTFALSIGDLHRVEQIIRTLTPAAQLEILLPRIYFSDSSPRKTFLLISLANRSASRVGRGMRKPSHTSMVSRTALSRLMRFP